MPDIHTELCKISGTTVFESWGKYYKGLFMSLNNYYEFHINLLHKIKTLLIK